MAVKTLSWLTYCRRAPFAEELQHALGTRQGKEDLDQKFLPALDIIDSLCAGLVVFDQSTGIIRLVHYTTKEYLVENHTLRNAETEITRTCINYLSFGAFSCGRSSQPSEYAHRQQLYPLHHYCAQNWGSHASAALAHSKELIDFLLEFLDKESNVHAASQAMMAYSILGDETPSVMNWLEFVPRRLTKTHLATHGGLADIISIYQSRDDGIDIKDSTGRTPFAYAAERGNLEIARILLESQRVDPDSKDHYHRTPLLHAAGNGHKEVVNLLIQYGADPNPTDYYGYSPLCAAAEVGSIGTMRFLLDNGAQIDVCCSSQDPEGGTALILAWYSGNKEAVQFLLDRGANPDFPNEEGYTILSAAAQSDDEELVESLIKKGVHLELRDYSGYTHLRSAVQCGHIGIVKLLLDAGADSNAQDRRDDSCLITATAYGFLE